MAMAMTMTVSDTNSTPNAFPSPPPSAAAAGGGCKRKYIMTLLEAVSTAATVTRLGNFWNFLATNFITKVALMFGDFLGSYEKH